MSDPGPATDEYDRRANIYSNQSGEVTPVRKDQIHGLDSFIEGWRHNVEFPHQLSFGGWQMSDEEHPAGTGRPAYRLVHKTIRTIPNPQVSMLYPNLRINVGNGKVTFGEPRFGDALAGRLPGIFIVPEWGELKQSGLDYGYEWQPNANLKFEGHQEVTPPTNYLEILYELPEGDWSEFDAMLAAGRAGVAELTAMIDFMYGARLLGPILTEEVGEVFEDWHWNRLLGGRSLGMESQARMEVLDGQRFIDLVGSAIEKRLELPAEERARLKVASQWYWRADSELDRVQKYIAYWLCIEALELGENANIKPVKLAVARILEIDHKAASAAVGEMYRIRNGLVHGVVRAVEKSALDRVEALAVVLLEEHSLGTVSDQRRDALRVAVELAKLPKVNRTQH
ncbi:hypothetical protein V5D56_15445 [Cellulosimicrobium sp. PMB13]|uniref:hypothetical protein n=1 Tax=Cellulosimicrobium sp. PMB13 TaxID=3120158 RepID=UPI003F4C4B96